MRKSYGWIPQLPDFRDKVYAISRTVDIPSSVDLRPNCPPIYDQGSLGSCTANAIAAAYQFDLLKEQKPDFMPSRLFIYYNERDKEGTVRSDAGARIRDGIKSIASQGVCTENDWPYLISKFMQEPPSYCYQSALEHQAIEYQALYLDLFHIRACLAEGNPFVFGFSVYDSFESDAVARNGIVPVPDQSESLIGGHAVLAVGYNDESKTIIVRNSWSDSWGDKGYCYFPYGYFTSGLVADLWTLKTVQ